MVSGTHRYKFQFQFEECNCWQLLLCWSANPIFVAFYYFLLALSLILLTLNRSLVFGVLAGPSPMCAFFIFTAVCEGIIACHLTSANSKHVQHFAQRNSDDTTRFCRHNKNSRCVSGEKNLYNKNKHFYSKTMKINTRIVTMIEIHLWVL